MYNLEVEKFMDIVHSIHDFVQSINNFKYLLQYLNTESKNASTSFVDLMFGSHSSWRRVYTSAWNGWLQMNDSEFQPNLLL